MFEPHPSLTDPEVRRRSQLLGVCLVVVSLLFVCVDISFSVALADYRPPWFGYLTLLATFLLNRFGYYRIAAPVTVAMFPCVIFTIVFIGDGMPFVSFGYLVIAPMVASIFLPMWGVAVVSLLDLGLIAASPLFAPDVVTSAPQLIGPLTANAMVGALSLLYMNTRQGLESDRRRALEDSEERLRRSLDAAQMGTWELCCGASELTLDARAQTLLGQPRDPEAWCGLLGADDAPRLRAALTETSAGQRSGFELTVTLRADAGQRTIDVTGHRVESEDAKRCRVIGTLLDVSRRHQLERQLSQSLKMEALGRMSGGIAHDFNNVLTVISSSVVLMRRRASMQELDLIDNATRSAAALTGKLLAFSRGAALAPRVLDLGEVVVSVLPLIERLIGAQIRVHYRPSPDRWLTRSDEHQLEQVLLNLAANARDAMPNGGELTIAIDNVTESHAESGVDAFVRLRVRDTGLGMDEETRRHLFEPFFTTKPRGEGTGLGLAMVFGAVTQSGGFIETQTAPGEGACFDLYFPRAFGTPVSQRSAVPQSDRGRETLLLVEDDAEVRKVVGLLLQDAGYRVLQAQCVSEARARFAEQQNAIALIVTDEVMSDGRGSDLVGELRRQRPTLAALRITGYVEPRPAASAFPLDLPTLQKPFEPALLLHRVRELLDGPASTSPRAS